METCWSYKKLSVNKYNFNISAQQANDTQHYENIKEKPYRTNTSTWFNKLWRIYIILAMFLKLLY
jgi:hypothetical protein